MPSNILNVSIGNTQNIPILIGNTSSFDISIQNISPTERVYNLSIFLTLPDGMTLSSSTATQTSSKTNGDNSTTYSWINLKDLAPMEVDYKFSITVKCNLKFKNGASVPFGYNFSGISVTCQVDTMPRGIYDIGNEIISKIISMSYTTVRFSSIITTSGNVLKGAGTSLALNDYTQVNKTTCTFTNNSVSSSLVNISILLENGIRYIGNISTSGTDSSKLLNPTISLVQINGKIYTQLYFGSISLSINSNTTLMFDYAVWNKTNNNEGALIPHGSSLNMQINMTSADPLVIASHYSYTTFLAMDLIIITSINKSFVDVQMGVIFTYVYKVGQYYNISDIVVNYFIPDGILYILSSSTPVSVIHNSTVNGYHLTYNFPYASKNSTNTITIDGKINSYYSYKLDSQGQELPIVASDPFLLTTDILGTLVELPSQVSDNSSTTASIAIGTITKQFVKGYYKNGTPKTINTLAPGDLAEYNLIYNASTLNAIQKDVYLSDFFPLSSDPIDNLTYVYTGVTPITAPSLISPHGVDFYYGDIPGLSSSVINFKAPIATLGSSTQNSNLMKLKGINTYGEAYSNRDQVNFNIGTPNITLSKSVAGPNKNAIKANEIYTYTIVISNTNNGTETDAFDFTLNDTLSPTLFTLDLNSITVSGTGSFNTPTVQGNNISMYINKLSPGSSLTLSYKVTISPVLAPGVTIITTASNTNPYSQSYDPLSTNFQYSNLAKSASATLLSQGISITKSNYAEVFKVGSQITYTIFVTVPLGTIAYGLYLTDVLPSGGQSYLGPCYKNGSLITPTVNSNTITFQTEDVVDSRTSAQSLRYIFTAKIDDATKVINSTTQAQTNRANCYFKQTPAGGYSSVSASLNVTINHPNIVMNLSVTDKTTGINYTQTAPITTNSQMEFTLGFQNNSSITLKNGTIEIPLSESFLFVSIDTMILCTATYNSSLNKIIITVPYLSPASSGYLSFKVLPKALLRAGSSITTQATAISYYNDISEAKVYGGEKSNEVNCILPPGVSLKPNPLYKIGESTSFVVTPPGNGVDILNYFKNTGGGYDDFTLKIAPVALPYSLFIDDIKIADVLANTPYQQLLPEMTNLAPDTSKIIKLSTTIPNTQSLGYRYDFVVTSKSTTSPYPESTVLNIDPHPF
ncbi:MAG: isopeptide-forming domain-containing fimbrial protein [Clostridium sp.]